MTIVIAYRFYVNTGEREKAKILKCKKDNKQYIASCLTLLEIIVLERQICLLKDKDKNKVKVKVQSVDIIIRQLWKIP